MRKILVLTVCVGLSLLSVSSATLSVEDLGFRYQDGKCINEAGEEGYNKLYFGQCADFRKALLGNLDFSGMDFSGSRFDGADLQLSKLVGTKLVGVSLSKANLDGVDFSEADFSNANLSEASFRKATGGGAIFDLVVAEKSDFTESNLSYSDFSRSRLPGAKFVDATLTEVVFSEANGKGCDFSGANLRGADFSMVKLIETSFVSTDLESGVFVDAELKSADFSSALARNSNFLRAQLVDGTFKLAKFHSANLTDANLSGSNLKVAFFQGASFEGLTMEGAIFNKQTRLPITVEKAQELGALFVKRSGIIFVESGHVTEMKSVLEDVDGITFFESFRIPTLKDYLDDIEKLVLTEGVTGLDDDDNALLLRKFVEDGGELILTGAQSSTISSIFKKVTKREFDLIECGTTTKQEEARALFPEGVGELPPLDATNCVPTAQLEETDEVFYKSDTGANVLRVPLGDGGVSFAGWCYYQAKPVGEQDGGWIYILQSLAAK